MRLTLSLILCLALTTLSPAEAPAKPPLALSFNLPDGQTWTLGAKAVGRPFMVRLVLANESDKPIQIWDPQNSEGSVCPRVILTDQAGKSTTLTPPGIARAAGIPTVWNFKPHDVRAIDIELLRLVDEKTVLPRGQYKIKAGYENTLANDFTFIKGPIFIGKLESEAQTITIIAP